MFKATCIKEFIRNLWLWHNFTAITLYWIIKLLELIYLVEMPMNPKKLICKTFAFETWCSWTFCSWWQSCLNAKLRSVQACCRWSQRTDTMNNSHMLLICAVQYLDFNLLGRGSAVHHFESRCCKHSAYFRFWRRQQRRRLVWSDELKTDVCTHMNHRTVILIRF